MSDPWDEILELLVEVQEQRAEHLRRFGIDATARSPVDAEEERLSKKRFAERYRPRRRPKLRVVPNQKSP